MGDSAISPPVHWTEAEKDRLIAELQEAVRARDEFVAIAAHELRNPMTPILMQVNLLLAAARDPERCNPETMVFRLASLEASVHEFVRRSTALLDISRIASGNLRFEWADVDFSALVAGVLDRTAYAAQRAHSPVIRKLQMGITGRLDRLAAEQVIENLITNAIKFGAGRPVEVSLQMRRGDAELRVKDHGIGIPREDQTRIFERFERAVTRREHGGFGIGLWLANQLVRGMGGTIAINSAPGEGTTFTVTLPLSDRPSEGRST